MKKLRVSISLSVLFLLAGLTYGQQSSYPTITFNVPIQCQNLHQDVADVHVKVNAMNQDRHIIGFPVYSPAVHPDANGSINQTVTVVLPATFDWSSAKFYNAFLEFKTAGNNEFAQTQPAGSDCPIALQAKPGTQFNPVTTGDITW